MTGKEAKATEKPPRQMYCKVCRRVTRHTFIGVQRFPTRQYDLYDCPDCGNTAAEEAR
jgi:hypothetical protein